MKARHALAIAFDYLSKHLRRPHPQTALAIERAIDDELGHGFGIARDTTASISDWGHDSKAVVTAMAGAIDDAGIRRADIDAIYSSANGNERGDRLEAEALGSLFGDSLPQVVATKSFFGEYAAGGALQLAAALVDLGERDLRHALVNSLSAGGGIVCAVVSRERG